MNLLNASWAFRASRPDDVERMYEVWRTSVVATHDFLSADDFAEICDAVQQNYLPNNRALVAVDNNDRVVGFMECHKAEIVSLFIHSEFRGKGVGREFVWRAASRWPMLSVSVNVQNAQAIGFYKAMGFIVGDISPIDDEGRPYPILQMHRSSPNMYK